MSNTAHSEAFFTFENKLILRLGFQKVEEIGQDNLREWFNVNRKRFQLITAMVDDYVLSHHYDSI